jgi:lysophospholipase
MLDLEATPRNPIPSGARVYALNTADNVLLRMARFSPPGAPRATVALFQGRAEFIEKYFETIDDLLARGFEVVTLDWRGQGGSERELANPRKGHVDDFAQYQRDLSAFLAQITRLACPKPWFALAHSMGGAILLEYAHGGGHFARLAVTAPMIDIHGLRFPAGARLLANVLDMLGLGAMFIPGGREASLVELQFDDNILTSDPARLARNAAVLAHAPRLSVGDPTIGWTNAAFRQIRRFAEPDYARHWTVPTLLIASGRDTLVSTRAVECFAQRLDIATLVTIPGARHEIMMERDELRELFFAAFDAFIPGGAEKPGVFRAAE